MPKEKRNTLNTQTAHPTRAKDSKKMEVKLS